LPWRIELKPAAQRDLARLPREAQRRIARRIDALADEPYPDDAKKLAAEDNIWRVRAGDYRILYQPQKKVLLILVIRIADRKEAYRR